MSQKFINLPHFYGLYHREIPIEIMARSPGIFTAKFSEENTKKKEFFPETVTHLWFPKWFF